jgi:hypothetical protein
VISWGYGWVGSGVYHGLVGSVCMLQVEAYGHSPGFGYRCETYELCSVLATGVRPVSSSPLVIVAILCN